MTKTFTRGQRVYNIHGQAASYVLRSERGHLVEPIYQDDDDEEPHFADATTWREVFTDPPTAVLQEECAKLEKQAAEARAEISALRTQRREFDTEERGRLDRIKRHSQLALLDDYLAGRITHFVEEDYSSIRIVTFADGIKSRSDLYGERGAQRLLSLHGKSNGDLAWRLNWYSDHSGSTIECVPCVSHEQAMEAAAARCDVHYIAARSGKGISDVMKAAKSADALGLVVPADIRKLIADALRESALKSLAEYEKRAADAQAALDECRAKIA